MRDNEFSEFVREAATYFGAKAEDQDIEVLGKTRIAAEEVEKDEAARAAEHSLQDEVNGFFKRK